jgi:hypothetical protein
MQLLGAKKCVRSAIIMALVSAASLLAGGKRQITSSFFALWINILYQTEALFYLTLA